MSELAPKPTSEILQQPAQQPTASSFASELMLQQVYSQLQPITLDQAKSFQSFATTMQSVQKELKDKNPDDKQIDGQLQSAITDADKIDRSTIQKDSQVVDQALKTASDPTEKKELQTMSSLYDSMLQASAQARIAKGEVDLNQKDYSTSKSLFEDAQKIDPTYANGKSVDVSKLIGEAHAPSFWDKLEHFGEDVLTGAVTVAAGTLGAVVGTAIGPGGTVFGAGLGATLGAAVGGSIGFTGAEAFEGKNVSWYTPLEGAGLGVLSAIPILGQGADAALTTSTAAGTDAALSTAVDTATSSATSTATEAALDTATTTGEETVAQGGLRSAFQTVRSYLPKTSISQKVVRHVASSVAIGTSGAASSSLSANGGEIVYADAAQGDQNLQAARAQASGDDGANTGDESPTLSRIKTMFGHVEGYFNRQPIENQYLDQTAPQLRSENQYLNQQLQQAGSPYSIVEGQQNPNETPAFYGNSYEVPVTGYQQPSEYQQAGEYQQPNEYQQASEYQQPNEYQQASEYQQPSAYQPLNGYQAATGFQPSGEYQPSETLPLNGLPPSVNSTATASQYQFAPWTQSAG